jgi:hypothetical protein
MSSSNADLSLIKQILQQISNNESLNCCYFVFKVHGINSGALSGKAYKTIL